MPRPGEHGDEEPDGNRRARQQQHRPADVLKARLQEQALPAADEAPVGPRRGAQRDVGVGVAARQVGHEVVLEAGQQPRGGQTHRDQRDSRAVENEPLQAVAERLAGRDQGAARQVRGDDQRRVIRALTDPGGKDLTAREARHAPRQDPRSPTGSPDRQFGAEECQWKPRGHVRVGVAADVVAFEKARVRVDGRGQQRAENVAAQHARQGVGRERREQDVKQQVGAHRGVQGQEGERQHGWQVHPTGLGVGGEGRARERVRVPDGNLPCPQLGAEERVPGKERGGGVHADPRGSREAIPLHRER
ncbi:MAG TPA: hypothetical protein VGK33_22820 [Chloroflexota bacterium]